MSRREYKLNQASGFSLIELLIVIVIISILASFAVIYLTASRRAANGASAIQSLRVISESEHSYAAGVGNKEYGDSQELFNEDFIDAGLARACIPAPTLPSKSGVPAMSPEPKSGFIFIFIREISNGSNPPKYNVLARPMVDTGISRTGDRTFYVDQTSVIRASDSPTVAATLSSKPIN
jgi:type IV pilus assembly protein PilA